MSCIPSPQPCSPRSRLVAASISGTRARSPYALRRSRALKAQKLAQRRENTLSMKILDGTATYWTTAKYKLLGVREGMAT